MYKLREYRGLLFQAEDPLSKVSSCVENITVRLRDNVVIQDDLLVQLIQVR